MTNITWTQSPPAPLPIDTQSHMQWRLISARLHSIENGRLRVGVTVLLYEGIDDTAGWDPWAKFGVHRAEFTVLGAEPEQAERSVHRPQLENTIQTAIHFGLRDIEMDLVVRGATRRDGLSSFDVAGQLLPAIQAYLDEQAVLAQVNSVPSGKVFQWTEGQEAGHASV